jgi:hypothetical protein
MRVSDLLLAGLIAATAPPLAPEAPAPADAAVPITPPEGLDLYSPATDATIDWLADVEAARLAAKAQEPSTNLASPATDVPSADGIHRCVGSDGNALFTDRGCAEFGATAAPLAGTTVEDIPHFSPKSCARTRSALLDGVRDALDARDPNRLASYYHWTGMGTRAAYSLMDRLYDFSQRPLVDVQLVRSAPRPDPMAGAVPPLWMPQLPAPEGLLPLPPPPRAPILVRVDQMRGNKDVASEVTYFHLTSNAGCWWIQF